ncbi:MAG TPA: TSUP family transporter [Geothrix sp.]|uniref:TSUP family transporter n=1 Tax=Geothrix mesophila TaxID=2922723 RepID=UPI001FAD6DC1|nr:TSUP family transporter [Geothrix sp. SG198]HJV39517.1 TSUP family transporter [Geothrix sp.]
MPSLPTLALLLLAALLAGFIDAVVGGGGLITVPALMLGLPAGTPLPTLLGTNKVVAVTGTTMAAGKFLRSGAVAWREMVVPVLASALGASGGVWLTYRVHADFLKPVMLGLLVAMLAFTLLKPDLGHLHAPRYGLHHQRGLAALIALGLGFYDGFFGPGTGSVLIFLFVAILGFDFLRSSALAKAVNWASNLTAMSLFVWRGSWIPSVALGMAAANGVGGYLGAHVALSRGSRWVRGVFIGVVGALILRLGWQVVRG